MPLVCRLDARSGTVKCPADTRKALGLSRTCFMDGMLIDEDQFVKPAGVFADA
jgi:hypothetical protein